MSRGTGTCLANSVSCDESNFPHQQRAYGAVSVSALFLWRFQMVQGPTRRRSSPCAPSSCCLWSSSSWRYRQGAKSRNKNKHWSKNIALFFLNANAFSGFWSRVCDMRNQTLWTEDKIQFLLEYFAQVQRKIKYRECLAFFFVLLRELKSKYPPVLVKHLYIFITLCSLLL